MFRPILLTLTIFLLALLPTTVTAQQQPEIDASWDLLFDSQNWKKDNRRWERPHPKIWTFIDGEIVGEAGPGEGEKHPKYKGGIQSYIISRKPYRRFHVAVEVFLEKGAFGIGQWNRGKTFFDQGVCSLNQWHELVMTFHEDKIDCYLNGMKLDFYGRMDPPVKKGVYLFCKEDSKVRFRKVRAKEFR